MVIFYDLETNNPVYTETGVLIPQLPKGTIEEKKQILSQENVGFVGVPYEMGMELFEHTLCFDLNGNFIGLQPK